MNFLLIDSSYVVNRVFISFIWTGFHNFLLQKSVSVFEYGRKILFLFFKYASCVDLNVSPGTVRLFTMWQSTAYRPLLNFDILRVPSISSDCIIHSSRLHTFYTIKVLPASSGRRPGPSELRICSAIKVLKWFLIARFILLMFKCALV